MNSNRTAGSSVQIVSISWPSIMNLLNSFALTTEMIIYMVMTVIKISTIIEWSWKNNNCSILGDVES
jgi:hypothetical protein